MAAEETTEPQDINDVRVDREPNEMHKALAAYIEQNTGIEPDVKTVQLVCNMRNEWRRTEDYAEFRQGQDARKAEIAKEQKAAKEKARQDREEAKAQKEAEQAAKAASTDGEDDEQGDAPAPRKGTRKGTAKKTTKKTTGTKKKTAARKPKPEPEAETADAEDDPFDD